MKKKDTDMMITHTKNKLTVVNSGVFDQDGKELVLACGYTHGWKFGYFICNERVYTDKDNVVWYDYSDQKAFYEKVDERAYQTALKDMKQRLTRDAV